MLPLACAQLRAAIVRHEAVSAGLRADLADAQRLVEGLGSRVKQMEAEIGTVRHGSAMGGD